ncbi:MAG: thiamine phosphate synthase [Proteobacteria bacterium]|nr:thiamine phosphate synthase [Pseudomonadota bacterium]MBU1688026.1 thiamine phosphate synthase [Pseudomonadota bacterium]
MPDNLLSRRMKIFHEEVTLYPVSCEKLANGRTDLEWLDSVLAGGARIVQLRDKESTDRVLYEKSLAFRRRTNETGALLIINNRLDIALMCEADGIHLGNSDLPAEMVRQWAPELIIGVSANTLEQAASAERRGASYFNIGPLFPTETKSGLSTFLGTEAVPVFAAESPLPFTVMGGIKRNHIHELIKHGAQRIAVVTALTQAEDIAQETKIWIEAINSSLKPLRQKR